MSSRNTVEMIAERDLTCVKPGGERVPVKLRIGKPIPVAGGDWTCRIEAAGLLNGPKDIFGVDSFQALFLAQAVLKSIVRDEIQKGSGFLAFHPEEPVSFEDIFPKDI